MFASLNYTCSCTTFFTHAGESHSSIAFIRVCLCVCVCVCVCVRTIQPTWLKLQSPNLPQPPWVLAIHLILGERSRSQGHKVTKCINIFQLKAIEWPTWVCTLSSVVSVYYLVTVGRRSRLWVSKHDYSSAGGRPRPPVARHCSAIDFYII